VFLYLWGLLYFCVICVFFVPLVLWYCWLGLLTCKTISQVTYTVLAETVNTAQKINKPYPPLTESGVWKWGTQKRTSRVCRGVRGPPFPRKKWFWDRRCLEELEFETFCTVVESVTKTITLPTPPSPFRGGCRLDFWVGCGIGSRRRRRRGRARPRRIRGATGAEG